MERFPHWSDPASFIVVGKGHWEDKTSDWPESWTQPITGSSAPPSSLKSTFYPPFTQQALFSRMQSWESKVVLRPSGQYSDWTQLRPLWKLLVLAGTCRYLLTLHSCARQASGVSSLTYQTCHLATCSGLPIGLFFSLRVPGASFLTNDLGAMPWSLLWPLWVLLQVTLYYSPIGLLPF